ncbi:MAG: metal-dependent hydrolase, partial [Gemmatimonadales bacterium]
MDPVCHSLVGATLSKSGLGSKLPSGGMFTLLVAANLPDIDVVTLFWGGPTSVFLRRGITHGLPAMLVLPVVWAMIVWLYLRRRDRTLAFGSVLAVSVVGVLTHPALDY